MPISVARIPNLECEAFYFDLERRGIALRDLAAAAVAAALERGDIDAGPVPLRDTFRLQPAAAPIAGFCVASVAQAVSCTLHSRAPAAALSGARIAVGNDADDTATGLLRVLLTQKFQVQGASFVTPESEHDALLLTGNQGLRRRRGTRDFPHRCDLGAEWREWTGLPFVFSRWMARADLERRDFAALQDALFVGQEDWLNNLYQATGPRNDLLMLPREVLEYIQGLRFYIGVPEQRAMALFQEKLALLEDGAD